MLETVKEINRKISILFLVFFIASAFIAPPDVLSQIILAAEMMIVFGVVFLIASGFRSYKEASQSKRIKIVIAACMFSIFVGFCTMFIPRVLSPRPEESEQIPDPERSETALE